MATEAEKAFNQKWFPTIKKDTKRTGKTPEQLAAEAEEKRLAEIARKEAADKLAAEQAASKKPAEIEAHKKTEDWKLKVGEKFKKGDYWGAAKSWWNKDEPKTPKNRKGDMVRAWTPKGKFVQPKPEKTPIPKGKFVQPKPEKAWIPKKRKGDMVKNYARGGGVRPADNEYR